MRNVTGVLFLVLLAILHGLILGVRDVVIVVRDMTETEVGQRFVPTLCDATTKLARYKDNYQRALVASGREA